MDVLELGHGDDITGTGHGDVHMIASFQEDELPHPLLLAPGGVQDGHIGRQGSGDHAKHRQGSGVAVDHGLEDDGREGTCRVRRHLDLGPLLRPGGRPGRPVPGRRQHLHDSAEQPVDPQQGFRGSAQDRHQLALPRRLHEPLAELGLAELALLEVFFEQEVVAFGDRFDQATPGFLRLLCELGGNLACALGGQRLHGQEVDDTGEVAVGPDRKRQGRGIDLDFAQRFHGAGEVGPFAVEPVDEGHHGNLQ